MTYAAYFVAAFVLASVVVAIVRACQIIGIILDYEDQRRDAEQ